MASHNELGKIGEEIAAQYLLRSGYKILRRNFYFDKAEIDIIAQKEEDTVVMVEVKTRNSDFFGDPQSFVTPAKIKLLVKAANEYVISNEMDVEVRFDIIAILKNKTESSILRMLFIIFNLTQFQTPKVLAKLGILGFLPLIYTHALPLSFFGQQQLYDLEDQSTRSWKKSLLIISNDRQFLNPEALPSSQISR